MISRRRFVQIGACVGAGLVLPVEMVGKAFAFNLAGQAPALDTSTLPKFVDRLPIMNLMPGTTVPGVDYAVRAKPNSVVVSSGMEDAVSAAGGSPYDGTDVWSYRPENPATAFSPDLPVTSVGGYGTPLETFLGPTFAIPKGTATKVKWINGLVDGGGDPIPHPLAVDPSLDWANPHGDTFPAPGAYPVDSLGDSTYDFTLDTVPLAPHVHGAEVISFSDGGPNSWFTPDAIYGSTYSTYDTGTGMWHSNVAGNPAPPAGLDYAVYRYSNEQQPATIWYHDHMMGGTRLNVYMGLAGGYAIYDPAVEAALVARGIPSVVDYVLHGTKDRYGQPFDIPLVVQDRMFDRNGQLFFPAVSDHPTINPFWVPEFFGDTMLVNGVCWPLLKVEPRMYRFRIIEGSNARFYIFRLMVDGKAAAFHQIATDAGYLGKAAALTSLRQAPGERTEILVDFSKFAGKTVTLTNSAVAPFPSGDPPTTNTSQIMQFKVDAATSAPVSVHWDPSKPINAQLTSFANTGVPTLLLPKVGTPKPRLTRLLTLNEVESPVDGNPIVITVNYSLYMREITEMPQKNSAEYWMIANMTMDAHPVHTHLVSFQGVSRQDYDVDAYTALWESSFPGGTPPLDALGNRIPLGPPLALVPDASDMTGYRLDVEKYATPLFTPKGTQVKGPGNTPVIGGNPDVTPFLHGAPRLLPMNERGWKDTLQMLPGQVTTIVARWSSNTSNALIPFSFDATAGPGYVWHCHIIDHEDNEMMRPYKVVAAG